MTLAEFDALLERHLDRERRAQLRAGIVAAAIYNANPFRSSAAKPITPFDFLSESDRRAMPPEQTLDEQIEILTAVFGCGPGKADN